MRRGKSTFTGCQRQADTLYSSLRSRLVRFHSRAKDIITATSILLLITAIVGWVLIFDEPTLSPASLLGDYLLSRLSTEGASNLSFTSIERNLFANLTINNLSYRRGKDLSITIDKTNLEGGLFNLFLSLFSSKPLLSLSFQEPKIYLGPNHKPGEEANAVPRLLRSWVRRLQLEALGTKGSFEADIPFGEIEVDDIDVALHWKLSDELPSFTIQARRLAAITPSFTLQSSHLLASLGQSGPFTFKGLDTAMDVNDQRVTIANLSVEGEVLSLKDRSLNAQATLRQGLYQTGDVTVETPELSFSGRYLDDRLPTVNLSVPSVFVNTPDLRAEGSHVDLHIYDLKTLLLRSERIDLTALETALTLLGIEVHLDAQENDLYYVTSTLNEGRITALGHTLAVHAFETLGQGMYQAGTIERVELQSSALGEVPNLFGIRFPLETSFLYDRFHEHIVGRAFSQALASDLFTEAFTFSLSYERDRNDHSLDVLIEQKADLRLLAHAERMSDHLLDFSLTGRFNHFSLGVIEPLLAEYAPFLNPYYTQDTALTGNLFFTARIGKGNVLGLDGRISLDGSLSTVRLGRFESSAGFLFTAAVVEDLVDVRSAALSAEGYQLSYSGEINLTDSFTQGSARLLQIDDNQLLATLGIRGRMNHVLTLDFSTPLVRELAVGMDVSLKDQRLVHGAGEVHLFDMDYPFTLNVDLSLLEFSLEQEGALRISGALMPIITIAFDAFYFTLPISRTSISGKALLSIDHYSSFLFESEQISIHNLAVGPTVYSIDAQLSISSDELFIRNARFTDWVNTYSGNAHYQGSPLFSLLKHRFLQPFSFNLSIFRDESPIIQTTLIGSSNRLQSMITTNGLSLGSFVSALEGTYLDLTLLGSSDLSSEINLSGSAELRSGAFSLSTKIGAEGDSFRLYDSFFRWKELTFSGDLLSIANEEARLLGSFEHIRHLSYIDQLSRLDVQVGVALPGVQNLFLLPDRAKPLLTQGIGTAWITIGEPLIFGEGGFTGGTHVLDGDGTALIVDGSFLNGRYEYRTRTLSARLDPSFGIGATIRADLRPESFGVKVEDIVFPLPYLNRTYLKPVFAFLEGTANGTVFLTGSMQSPRIYGQLSVDSSQMTTFWVYDDVISLKNLSVSIDGNRAISPHLPFFSTNRKTGNVITGTALLRAQLDGLGLDHYEITIESIDDPIYLWIPMLGYDVDITLWAEGTFNLWGKGLETWISGDLLISDAVLSLGVRGLPDWYTLEDLTSSDFNFTTDKGVTFLYPNITNPIIKATISEGEKLSFTYDHLTNEITMDGSLALRSGEIYYFQKDFFITEGALTVHTESFGGLPSVQPTINLRAKLTDYDSSGNRVDIFLILREASFTALNPQFESIPAKATNEIFEILGQSILPSGAYGQFNLYSVAHLAAAATNVAERLGYISVFQTSALTETIRVSLGLDMFSLRSNILQNILLDTLPGATPGTTFSPLARYLNNTVIFMGKYIGTEFFLQALLHLSATEPNKIRNPFLAPDLSLNLELSIEWHNPLLTFSLFTQPNELSFIDILDTMGVSVTKRIVLR